MSLGMEDSLCMVFDDKKIYFFGTNMGFETCFIIHMSNVNHMY